MTQKQAGLKEIAGLFTSLAAAIILPGLVSQNYDPREYIISVEDTKPSRVHKSHKPHFEIFAIDLSTGQNLQLDNRNDIFSGKWDGAEDLQKRLQIAGEFRCKVKGMDLPFLSLRPNIMSCVGFSAMPKNV